MANCALLFCLLLPFIFIWPLFCFSARLRFHFTRDCHSAILLLSSLTTYAHNSQSYNRQEIEIKERPKNKSKIFSFGAQNKHRHRRQVTVTSNEMSSFITVQSVDGSRRCGGKMPKTCKMSAPVCRTHKIVVVTGSSCRGGSRRGRQNWETRVNYTRTHDEQ